MNWIIRIKGFVVLLLAFYAVETSAQFVCANDIGLGTGNLQLRFDVPIDCNNLDMYQNIKVTVDGTDYEYYESDCGNVSVGGYLNYIAVMTGAPANAEVDAVISVMYLDAGYTAQHDDGLLISCTADAPIPTLSQWGIIILSMIMLILGVVFQKHSSLFQLQGKN